MSSELQSLKDTLTFFYTDLSGNSSEELSARMSYYEDKQVEFNRDFYTLKINSDKEIRQIIEDILKVHNLPGWQMGRYLDASLTVNEFLIELYEHNNNAKLKLYIDHIKALQHRKWGKILFGTVIGLAVCEGLLPLVAYFGGLTALQALFAAALFLPAVGLIFTFGIGVYAIYKNLFDKSMTLWQRFQSTFLLLANVALKFTAYTLLIAAAATTSPLVATLFVAAAIVNVIRELVRFVHFIFEDMKKGPMSQDTDLNTSPN